MRASTGRGGADPSRSENKRCSAARESGPGWMRSRPPAGNARTRPSGSSSAGVPRRVNRRPQRTGSRRATNAIAAADAGSSHWTSSTATSTDRFSDNAARTPTSAVAVVRGCAASSPSDRRSAAPRARCCTGGSARRVSSNTASTRSATVAYERLASLSAGCAVSTLAPRDSALAIAASQMVVLPIPASPSTRSAEASLRKRSRNRSTTASSASRPTIAVNGLMASYLTRSVAENDSGMSLYSAKRSIHGCPERGRSLVANEKRAIFARTLASTGAYVAKIRPLAAWFRF